MTELRREHSRAVGRSENPEGKKGIQDFQNNNEKFLLLMLSKCGGRGSNGPTIEYAAVAPPAPRPIRTQSHQQGRAQGAQFWVWVFLMTLCEEVGKKSSWWRHLLMQHVRSFLLLICSLLYSSPTDHHHVVAPLCSIHDFKSPRNCCDCGYSCNLFYRL